MPDLDRVLAPLLDPPLAEPDGIAELHRRASRLRRRRRARRLAATVTVTAAVVVGAMVVGPAGQEVRTTPPANTPDGAPDQGPLHPGRMELADLKTVGSIETAEGSWQLLAGYDDIGNLCTGLMKAGAASSGCSDQVLGPGELFSVASAQDLRIYRAGESVTTLAGDDPTTELDNTPFLWGPVAKGVATIRLELRDGRRIDVGAMGSEAGLPVNFYAVPVPQDGEAVAMAALDPDGLEVGRRLAPFWPPTPPRPCLPPGGDTPPCAPVAPPGEASVVEERPHTAEPG